MPSRNCGHAWSRSTTGRVLGERRWVVVSADPGTVDPLIVASKLADLQPGLRLAGVISDTGFHAEQMTHLEDVAPGNRFEGLAASAADYPGLRAPSLAV